jgi:probable F420-dependent oxidoreductase
VLIDTALKPDLDTTMSQAVAIEAAGYDGLWASETKHDPFLMLVRAADATEHVTLSTSIAIAFARTPMTLAYTGHDLARYAQGRFILGLGSQVKPHIERRFGMPWSHPAARMRELVSAMRAIWSAWQDGTKLDFRGDFYTHTLMTPFFAPDAHEWGPPPVYLAGVGARMTEVAGEVCDGFIAHPFTTPRYFREVTQVALAAGRAAGGHADLTGFTIAAPAMVAVGRTEEELASSVQGMKRQIAFYASTPAYKGVLDLHGWGDLQPELGTMARQGRWDDMTGLIPDELLHEMAVVGDPATVATGLHERLYGVAQRISLYAPYDVDPAVWPEVVAELRAIPEPPGT